MALQDFFEDEDTLQENILDKEFEDSLSEMKAKVLLEKFLDCYYSNYQNFKDVFEYKKHGNRIYVYLQEGPIVYYDMVENKIGLSKKRSPYYNKELPAELKDIVSDEFIFYNRFSNIIQ